MPEHAPHTWNKPVYGRKIQTALEDDTAKTLDKKGIRDIQMKVGTFLYYAGQLSPLYYQLSIKLEPNNQKQQSTR